MNASLTAPPLTLDEGLLRFVLENGTDGVEIVSREGIFQFVSPVTERMLGYSAAELVGQSIAFITHPDDLPGVRGQLASAARTPSASASFECRLRRKDGAWRVFEIAVRLLPGGDTVSNSRDITERKQAEEKLRAIVEGTARQTGDDFFHALVRHLATALGVRHAFVAETVGHPVMRVRTLAFWSGGQIVANIEYPLTGTPCEAVIGGEVCYYAHNIQALFPADKDLVTLGAESYLGLPLRDAAGRVLGHVAVLDNQPMRDETRRTDILRIFAARAGAELERLHTEAALRALVEGTTSTTGGDFFRILVRHIAAALNVRYGFVTEVVDAATSRVRTLASWNDDTLEDNFEYHWAGTPCQAVIETGQLCYYPRNVAAQFPAEDWLGEAGVQSYLGAPLFDAARNVIGHLVVMDVEPMRDDARRTAIFRIFAARAAAELERQRAEAKLRQRTAELSAANLALAKASRLKDEFLASMSHELRTPLTGILAFAQVMQKSIYGSLNEKQLKAMRSIEDSGHHLLELINDILDLSKIEADKMEMELAVVLADEVCQSSLRLVKGMAQAKNQKLTYRLDPPDLRLRADNRRLKQMLVNLLSNAIKFTPASGKLGLVVEGDSHLRVVRFTVWDTGIGIPAEQLPKLFQSFVQLDGRLAREHTGTGLGLALVRRMAEMHGGRVTVTSEGLSGLGSRFTITLPWGKSDETRPPSDTSAISALRPAPVAKYAPRVERHQSRVLLAEDNETIISALSDYLNAEGYEIILARNGREAVTRAIELRPDAILMDVQMPGMDGLEATRLIRAETGGRAGGPRPYIIAMTANAMPGDREMCLEAGMDDYISKPVHIEELQTALKQAGIRLAARVTPPSIEAQAV